MSGTRLSAKLKLQNVDAALATLELTMSIADWKLLIQQLNKAGYTFPAWKVIELIQQLVNQADLRFHAEGSDE